MLGPIELDKKAHFFSGANIAFATAILLIPFIAFLWAVLAGVAMATLAGWVKEWGWDARYPTIHTVDKWDFVATAAGGVAAAAVLLLQLLIVRILAM